MGGFGGIGGIGDFGGIGSIGGFGGIKGNSGGSGDRPGDILGINWGRLWRFGGGGAGVLGRLYRVVSAFWGQIPIPPDDVSLIRVCYVPT